MTDVWDIWGNILEYLPSYEDLRNTSATCHTLRRLGAIVLSKWRRRAALRAIASWKKAEREGKTYRYYTEHVSRLFDGSERLVACPHSECVRHLIDGLEYRFSTRDLLKPSTCYIPRRWEKSKLQRAEGRLHTFENPDQMDVTDAIFVSGRDIRRVEVQCGGQSIYVSHHLGVDVTCYELPFYLPVLAVPGVELIITVIAKSVNEVECRQGYLNVNERRELYSGVVRVHWAGKQITFDRSVGVTVI